jgi:KaiC/GvpD/RAD55 family RecA-like ATPase
MTLTEKKKSQEVVKKNDFERVPTGIPGLDELIEGGFIKGSTILITGGTGTGKTTFCAQYLLEGLKRGEPCVYISLEEDPEDIKNDVKRFGFDLEKYEKQGLLKIIYQNPFEVSDLPATIISQINSMNAKRVVIDPISLVGMYMKDSIKFRKNLYDLLQRIKKTGVTTLLTSEILDNEIGIGEKSGSLSRDGVSEFIADGVIVLNLFGIGQGISRSIIIRKMRRTNHGTDVYPMVITNKGIAIKRES